tara:strand:+ start:170 stop:418 length:249 start_codon:yes stop_codon:yes gene_type:complete
MLCRRHKARHEYAQRFLAPMQDWVQLPTKAEMDIYRGKVKPDLIITSATWDVPRLKIKKYNGQKKQKEETNERNEKVSGGIA